MGNWGKARFHASAVLEKAILCLSRETHVIYWCGVAAAGPINTANRSISKVSCVNGGFCPKNSGEFRTREWRNRIWFRRQNPLPGTAGLGKDSQWTPVTSTSFFYCMFYLFLFLSVDADSIHQQALATSYQNHPPLSPATGPLGRARPTAGHSRTSRASAAPGTQA